jgi:hypothetical protein
MIWTIWAFLIIWSIIAVAMFVLKASATVAVVGGFFVTIILLIILHFIVKLPPPSPEKIAAEQQKMDSIDAGTSAEISVKKLLKTPTTAKFPNVFDFPVVPAQDRQRKPIKDVKVFNFGG